DVQIAFAGELERKPTMLGQLLEHVIEKTDASADLDRRRRVEADASLDVGFLRAPLNMRLPRGESPDNFGPGLRGAAVAAHEEAPHAEIAPELQIRFAIADHGASCKSNVGVAKIVLHESDLRLATLACVRRQVGTHEYRVEFDTL